MKVLILVTPESIRDGQSDPARLSQLLQSAGDASLQVDHATYDDLSFVMAKSSASIAVTTTGHDIADYDVVYLRRVKEGIAPAMAVGRYGSAKGVAVFDSEIANRQGSMGKLTQYMQFSLAGVPFPDAIYSPSHINLVQAFQENKWSFPVVVKSVSGRRGSDNHLVHSQAELERVLAENPDIHFLIQKYVPNTSDYRVWVCGDQIGPILHRTRQDGHLNNTSQGGDALLLDGPDALPAHVRADCVKAAKLLHWDIAGVDVVFANDDLAGEYYFFEANRAPQVEGTPHEAAKAAALLAFMERLSQQRTRQ